VKKYIFLTKKSYTATTEEYTEFYKECSKPEQDYLDSLKTYKDKNVKLNELKYTKNAWSVSKMFEDVSKMFETLKQDRLKYYDIFNMPYWAASLKNYMSLMKSYNYVGVDIKVSKEYMSKYQSLYNNIKEDYAKKIGSYIVQLAVAKNCDIIVLEELKSNLGSVDRKSKRDNEMSLMWNCGRIKTHVENMAKDYGMFIDEVPEYGTSQVYHKTGNYGYRDEDNREIFWYEDNKDVAYIHADENAAINIAKRFLSQHTDNSSFSVILKGDAYYLNIASNSKRMRAAALKTFGDLNKPFKINANDKNGNLYKKTRIFKSDSRWIGVNDKDLYIEHIKSLRNLRVRQ